MRGHTRIAALALALALAGCGAQGAPSMGSAQTPEVNDAQAVSSTQVADVAGSEAVAANAAAASLPAATEVGEGSTTIRVANATGYDIAQVAVKPASAEEYAASNTFSGFRFADGTAVDLSFSATDGDAAYDVLLTTVDSGRIAVRGIDLIGLQDLTLCFDQGVGYVTFTDPSTGETTDNQSAALDAESSANIGATYDMENQRG